MRACLSIFKKEFFGFLLSPSFLLVCALTATLLSWLYPISLKTFMLQSMNFIYQQQQQNQQSQNIHYGVFLRHLSYLNLILILIVPALTMRLFAEEKKMRTMDLLLTAPVTSTQIVAGKFAAVLGAILALIVLALLYPAVTAFYASFSWTVLLIAFFGLFLIAAVYASMGILASSLTESAIIAYVMAVLFNISIWFIGVGTDVVDSPVARQIFEHISLNQHLSGLVEGTVRTTSLVFFLSLIFLFCFLTERVVESSRWR